MFLRGQRGDRDGSSGHRSGPVIVRGQTKGIPVFAVPSTFSYGRIGDLYSHLVDRSMLLTNYALPRRDAAFLAIDGGLADGDRSVWSGERAVKLLFLAWRNIRYYQNVSLAIIVSVAIAVALLFFGLIVNWGVSRGLEVYAQRLGADLIVVPKNAADQFDSVLWLGQPVKAYFHQEVLSKLRSTKGVNKVSPQLFLESAAASCCTAGHVFLIGYDSETDFTLLPWIRSLPQGKPGVDDVIVGSNIIQPVGLNLVFYNHRFKIAAQLDRTGLGIYDNAVYLPMETAYKMAEESRFKAQTNQIDLKNGQISSVMIQLKEGADPVKVSREIERLFPSLKAVSTTSLAQAVRRKMPQLQRHFALWLAVVWLSVFFLLEIIFYLLNQSRRREHGILRAMGGSKKDLVLLVILESSLLMVAGGAAGIVLAVLLKTLFYQWLALSLSTPLLYPVASVQLAVALFSILAVLIVGLLGTVYPAYSIASKEPYESIRYSG